MKDRQQQIDRSNEAIRKLNDFSETEKKIVALAERWKSEIEYEEIECVCPMTGTIEYMKRIKDE